MGKSASGGVRMLARVRAALQRRPVVVLTGPRQSGKTTLARQILDPAASTHFDLEDPRTRVLFEQPMTLLEPLTGLVVIDEVQRAPDLFPFFASAGIAASGASLAPKTS